MVKILVVQGPAAAGKTQLVYQTFTEERFRGNTVFLSQFMGADPGHPLVLVVDGYSLKDGLAYAARVPSIILVVYVANEDWTPYKNADLEVFDVPTLKPILQRKDFILALNAYAI